MAIGGCVRGTAPSDLAYVRQEAMGATTRLTHPLRLVGSLSHGFTWGFIHFRGGDWGRSSEPNYVALS